MDLTTLTAALRATFDVDTNRYPDAQACADINAGIRALAQKYNTPWGQATGTFPTAIGTANYDPTTLLVTPPFIRPLAVYYGATLIELTELDREHWRRWYAGAANGTPVGWLYWASQLWLAPPPAAAAISVTVDYVGEPVPLSAGGDRNDWTDDAETAVLDRAAQFACVFLQEGSRIPEFQALLQGEMERLEGEWAARAVIRSSRVEAATLTGLRGELGDLLGVDVKTYPMAARTIDLNRALANLSRRTESPYDEATVDIHMVAGQTEYDLATLIAAPNPTLRLPLLVSYVNADGEEVRIEQLDYLEMRDTWPEGSDQGAPEHVAFWQNKMVIGPPPDTGWEVDLAYRGRPRPLSLDTDTNLWCSEATNLVLAEAARLACSLRLGDSTRAAEFATEVERELGDLVIEWSQRPLTARDTVAAIEPGGGW